MSGGGWFPALAPRATFPQQAGRFESPFHVRRLCVRRCLLLARAVNAGSSCVPHAVFAKLSAEDVPRWWASSGLLSGIPLRPVQLHMVREKMSFVGRLLLARAPNGEGALRVAVAPLSRLQCAVLIVP